ncbi:MAG: hypothetical protein GC159_01430 [Phycisphaera sp.]|nr:hypothetical protein [Phycisphaera sp.]
MRYAMRLMLLALVLTVVTPSVRAAENLIGNPSLEEALGFDGLPEGWALYQSEDDGQFVAEVVAGGHSGDKALLIRGKGTYGVVLAPSIEPKAGRHYVLSGWVKLEGKADATATIKVDYQDDDGGYLASVEAGRVTTADKGWQPVVLSVCPKDVSKIAASMVIAGEGKAWFDDLRLIDAGASHGNLILNGEMEDRIGDRVGCWWSGANETGRITMTRSTDNPHGGEACMRLTGDAEWAVAVSSHVPFDKTKTYTAAGFVRTNKGACQVKIDYYNGDEWLGQTVSDNVSGATWQKSSTTSDATAYPNATHIAATVLCAEGFDVFVDDVTLTSD